MMRITCFVSRLVYRHHKFSRLSPFASIARQLTALALVGAMVTMTVPPVLPNAVAGTASARSSQLMRSAHPGMASFGRLPDGTQQGGMPQSARALPQEEPPLDPPSEEELRAKVSKLEMNPDGEVALQSGQPMVMAAIPLDAEGNIVQGLVAEWESDDRGVVFITRDGQALAGREGTTHVTATAGQKKEKVKVIVIQGAGSFGGPKRHSARTGATGGTDISGAKIIDARWSRGALGQVLRRNFSAHASGASFIRAAVAPEIPPDADPLPDDETSSLYTPTNAVGSPPGQTGAETATPPAAIPGRDRAGSANFTFGVPLVGLPGRAGLDVNLSLVYNSRLWHKSTRITQVDDNGNETWVTNLTYDVDNGWPATGFKLGYGQMESQGSSGFTLTDGDGTRHEMRKLNPSDANDHNYESTDGTFILFNGGRGWGTVTYTDGTRVEYGAAGTGARSYPTKIMDRNGNYILVSYRTSGGQQVGPQIASVRDTLSRYVYFNYNAGGKLVTITAPHYGGGAARQVARFYYEDISISKSFTISATAPATTSVIRHIYFPGTENGYAFDYSAYGMIYNIAQLRGMTVSSTSLTNTGTVTGEGQEAASTLYNYPTVAGNLTDVPKFTRRTDDWAGRTTASKPFYTFAVNETLGTTTITAPDASVTETRTIVAENLWNNGLVSETSIKTGTTVLARNLLTWEHDGNQRNPRLQKAESINEAGQSRTTVYSYTSYNNVSVVSERDFSAAGTTGAELRRTETTYETGAAWTSRRLLRLPQSVKVFKGGSTTPASRVDYVYDTAGTNLTARDNLVMHDDAYDPYGQTLVEGNCPPGCPEDPSACIPDCEDDYYISYYQLSTDYRGNVTQVTAYADAATGTLATAAITTYSYDIAGNVVAQTASCCQQKTITYTSAYKYAYPTEAARGDAGQLVTKATYDFNTGVVRTATDENNQVTTIHYWPETLRHFKTIRPDTGYTQQEYDDSLSPDPAAPRLHSYIKTSVSLDGAGTAERLLTSYQYLDGRGAVARTFGQQTSDGYATSDIEYDSMGRPFKTSNPYYTLNGRLDAVNPSAKWTKRTFDKLGRVTLLTLPDNTTVETSYAGDAVTVTDQAGKQRRQITDALGRVERVDEPDATGNLGTVGAPIQPTSYVYDALDNLVKVTQGAQKRYFKYDSLSRLTHERQVEQDAPHYQDDTVTANDYWSRRYTYNTDSLLTNSYDARNIRSHFDYDGLNRLTKITYTGEAVQTPNVTYTYDEAVSGYFNKGRLTQVETKMWSTVKTSEQYNYTKMGEVAHHTETVNGTSYVTKYQYNLAGQLTKETYPSLRAVSYSYDEAGRLARVADGSRTYAEGMEYAAHGGLLSEALGNGTVHSASYNTRLQPTQIKLTMGASVLQRYDYAYGEVDAATGAVDATKNTGQIARIEGYIGSVKQWQQRMSYDSLGRLTLASEHPGTSTTEMTYRADYGYDRYGNRSQDGGQNSGLPYTEVRAIDISGGTNRYKIATGVEYDASGQVRVDPKFRGREYQYEANGRQRWTARLDGTGVATALYDGAGQRVETTANGETRQVVYDAYGQMVAEYEGGVWARDYIYRGGQMVASVEAGAVVRYVMSDLQGSARVTMDASGGILARHDYLPFGEEIQAGTGLRTTAQGYGAADERRQKYAMLERDSETGQDHAWWRKYENTAGRWTTPDPYTGSMSIGDPQSLNRYAYVSNDPVNFIDPSGLEETLTCYVDGILMPNCSGAFSLLNSGAGVVGPLNMRQFNYNYGMYENLYASADGFIGYLPQGAVYNGNGYWGFPGAGSNGPPVLHDGLGSGTGYGQPLEGGRLDRTTNGPVPCLSGERNFAHGEGGGGQQKKGCQKGYASCVAKCMKDNSFFNLVRGTAGDTAASLTIGGTIVAGANQGLNLTSLGRYPRGGIKGPVGSPTSWQHTVFGQIGRSLGRPGIGTFGKVLGRASAWIAGPLLSLEGGYTAGTGISCAAICSDCKNR